MAKKASQQELNSERLTKAMAEQVFGWKTVHKYHGKLIGKKQDKVGHWRKATVPSYAANQRLAYTVDERMKQLGRFEHYARELARITKANNLPAEWATPEQRCQAALKASTRHLHVAPSKKEASSNSSHK